jgi:hypothetical protein
MKLYIECFREDDTPIMGNCEGQAVLHCEKWRRTDAYRRIQREVNRYGEPVPDGYCPHVVHHAKIVTPDGKILETITKEPQCHNTR